LDLTPLASKARLTLAISKDQAVQIDPAAPRRFRLQRA
jgi:hypothetical protein